MLILAIVLIVLGAVIAGAPLFADIRLLGIVLLVVGVVLLIVALVPDAHAATAGVFAMAGVPPGGVHLSHGGSGDHGDGFKYGPRRSLAQSQPVILAFIVAAVPIVAAFILQILEAGGTSTPLWLRTLLTGVGGVTTGLAAAWAHAKVTPTAEPKLDDGTALVPLADPVARPRRSHRKAAH